MAPSLTPGGKNKRPRPYGFSCNICRGKKVKCDGDQPVCRRCMDRGIDCSYSHTSQRTSQERQNDSLNDLFLIQNDEAHGEPALSSTSYSANSPVPAHGRDKANSSSLPVPTLIISSDPASDPPATRHGDAWAEVSLDQDGAFSFHGPTSRFHVALDDGTQVNSSRPQVRSKEIQIHELTSNYKLCQEIWQPLALAQMQDEENIPADVCKKLLEIYWTWQHPLHNCVYKPYFIRDLALGGPYFSRFLLTSIFALAGRHSSLDSVDSLRVQKGEWFLEKAKLLLLEEMSAPRPRIPTIQALLVLAGRQCATGKISEGWLYTGMAIRMLRDVGLHLSPERLNDFQVLDAGDLEARKRLFLSAYIWDKSISISLGRPPSLTAMSHGVDDILDFNDDSDVWKPVMIDGLGADYPTTASFATSTFKEFCRLGEIISRIYSFIYTRSNQKTALETPQRLEDELRSWYNNIPSHLRMSNLEKLTFCPPPHIYSLNLLYHTLFILIYRPFFQDLRGRKACIDASIIINDYLVLYMRTFDFRIMTYLVSYCVYTTATINAMEIKSMDGRDPAAVAARLSTSLKVLEREVRQTPGIHRSVDIIKNQLRTTGLPPRRETQNQSTVPANPPGEWQRPTPPHHSWTEEAPQAPPSALPIMSMSGGIGDENDWLAGDYGMWDIAGGFQPDVYRWTLDDASLPMTISESWAPHDYSDGPGPS